METLNLYQKLAKIQEQVKGLGKDKQGHGYQYVTGAKVLEYIKPIMIEYGVLLKQEIISIENVRQDYMLKSGSAKSEILSKVMMKFTWIDADSGQTDENLFGANGQNDWDKGVGSALTYGERYFLLKYFHINTDEDDIDNPERKEQGEASPLSDEQKAELQIKTAVAEMKSVTTLDDLKKIWSKYKALQTNAEFIAMKDERKLSLTNKTAA